LKIAHLRSDKMKRRRRKFRDEYLATLNLKTLIDIMTRNHTTPNHHRCLPSFLQPPSHIRQRRNTALNTRPRSSRPVRYPVLPRQHFPAPEPSFIDMLEEKREVMNFCSRDGMDGIHLEEKAQDGISIPEHQNMTPQSSSPPFHPSSTTPPPTPPLKSSTVTTDPWRIQYCIEREHLSPRDSKPSSLLFLTPKKITRESKHSLRKITKLYPPENLFGLGTPRKAHLREIRVTFSQIWNRNVIVERWEQQSQDSEGYLSFEDQQFKIQLQRHHTPGTLFFATGAGDLNINDPSMSAPDVCFQIADAPGQEFIRSERCEYDLKLTVEVEEGQLEASFLGIDGKEIKFDIKGRKIVRVKGEGMPRNWEGTDRGDLLVEIVVVQ
jgi:hypothetical protein